MIQDKDKLVARTIVEVGEHDVEETEGCVLREELDPCTIVIFGASGDLTSRKLFPALYNLFVNDGLPEDFIIVGSARSEMSDEQFREKMKDAVSRNKDADMSVWEKMSSRLFYRAVTYDDQDTFQSLASELDELDERHNIPGNRLFYLAVPPTVYETITQMLGASGLSAEDKGWRRVVIEKPFGRDVETARKLNNVIAENFSEHQVFRIDHYLAKETVQNILMLRFSNSIFEPIWNRMFIDSVHITASETLGVGHRAGYYEQSGVIRDMFQNHMMQLLALSTMEPPSLFEAERVRDEKTKVFRSLKPFPVNRLEENLVLGQYTEGTIEGEQVPGYREEEKVAEDSLTPTYAMMKVHIENWRWQGVPIFMTSGKRLKEKRTEIVVKFKEVPFSMFRSTLGEHVTANQLTMSIYPDEKIDLTIQTKAPGPRMCLRSVTMEFNYNQGYQGPSLEAYEKVLLDCIVGDHTLFWRQDSIELCWSFLTPILEECECPDRPDLHFYKAGTWGPEVSAELIKGHV